MLDSNQAQDAGADSDPQIEARQRAFGALKAMTRAAGALFVHVETNGNQPGLVRLVHDGMKSDGIVSR